MSTVWEVTYGENRIGYYGSEAEARAAYDRLDDDYVAKLWRLDNVEYEEGQLVDCDSELIAEKLSKD